MGEGPVAVGKFDPEHGVWQEFNDFSLYVDNVFSRHVRISGWPLVIKTVCSKWAEGLPSVVTTVQPSDKIFTPATPILTMGSMARVMPALSLGPVPLRP